MLWKKLRKGLNPVALTTVKPNRVNRLKAITQEEAVAAGLLEAEATAHQPAALHPQVITRPEDCDLPFLVLFRDLAAIPHLLLFGAEVDRPWATCASPEACT